MNRVRIALVAAGMAAMLVAGVALGGALDVAHADDGGLVVVESGASICPVTNWEACVEEYRATFAAPAEEASKDGADAEAEAEAEAVTCSLVDGCTVNVVDADGKTVKVMHITFTDAESAEVSLE